jgi:MoxR-like ATPase
VNTDDVQALAMPVLAHRLVTNFSAEAEGITRSSIVEQLIRDVPRGGAEKLR